VLAAWRGDRTSPMAAPARPCRGVADRRSVLSGQTAAEEARCCQASVGMQSLSTARSLEVRPLLAIVLLLQAVSECELAHRAQARLLQAVTICSVGDIVRLFGDHLVPRNSERSVHVRLGPLSHPSLLHHNGDSWWRCRSCSQEDCWC
jgi:hypothetical protein